MRSFPEPTRRACGTGLSRQPLAVDQLAMDAGAFAMAWSATLATLAAATWSARRSDAGVRFEAIGLLFLVGVAAGLVMYLAPSGTSSVRSIRGVEPRFAAALALSWLVALIALRRVGTASPAGFSRLALAGFAGVSVPLLALAAASFMVCGSGNPTCAL